MRKVAALLLVALCGAEQAGFCDAGVLIPAGSEQPDPAVFALREMSVEIRIDNGIARTQIRQIYGNLTGGVKEGIYKFALPANGVVSDFAVWEDVVRIPGVILERKRAEEIYNRARAQPVDPGLLQIGDGDASEARRSSIFTVKIVPIPAYATKRVEIEYQEPVAVENLESVVAVPLRPDVYRTQTAGHLSVVVELRSAHAIKDFAGLAKSYPLRVIERTPNLVRAEFFGYNVALAEDLAMHFTRDGAQANQLRILTQREGGDGFFSASALLAPSATGPAHADSPRTVIALFDNSLSMQWEKLERSFQACEALLHRLRPLDTFNLLLFNSDLSSFAPAPAAATTDNVEQALAFIRNSRIRGGTDLQRALRAGLVQASKGGGEPYIVLLSDGGSTDGLVQNGKLAAWYSAEWNKLADARRPHTLVFGVGDDANEPLLKMLASNRGLMEWVRSTEPIDFKLNAFLSKIGREPVKGLALTASPASNFDLIYTMEDVRFAGSMATWTGRYKQPLAAATFEVKNTRMTATAAMPAQSSDHPLLPRSWAKARVDALLEKIEREGEDRDSIDEIIRLSKKYKFVTPYTSFLAAPRALLRPRIIRPGDPVLRVRTDESIVSAIALFPFGLVKPLRYLKSEDVWQTRFLAPVDMEDGTHALRLVLRDRAGHVYRESKTFVIASKPPVVRVKLDKLRARAGSEVHVAAYAGSSARTIVARLYGAAPVSLRWSSAAKANVGDLLIPVTLPPGKYKVNVTAEDIAHNIGSQEVTLEVW